MSANGKTIVCACEDVLLEDVLHAIDTGYRDIESIKRVTGFGTGVCQGKSCITHVVRVLVERGCETPDTVQPFATRPPIEPIPLCLLAGIDDDNDEQGA